MLSPIARRELIRKLKKIGFNGPYSGGKHQFFKKDNSKIFIPNPHGKDIGIVLIDKIIKQLGISPEDFIKL
jgi:predicted RNA binding protein YcfA (HicA-like mRNA interferase family)